MEGEMVVSEEHVVEEEEYKHKGHILTKAGSFKTSIPSAQDQPSTEFDCNICLESVQDPVVTLCGHLYCWPCIYKWLNLIIKPSEEGMGPQCPVCKARLSQESLVPLFGRGQERNLSSKAANTTNLDVGTTIPRRPRACASVSGGTGYRQRNRSPERPVIGVVGELVHTGVVGTSMSNLLIFSARNYRTHFPTSRAGRLVIQTEGYLNRIFLFLFCCAVLCFLVF